MLLQKAQGDLQDGRSKTWRSPSPPKIHQKYIYMWNNSYRTHTECWQKTSDFPKGLCWNFSAGLLDFHKDCFGRDLQGGGGVRCGNHRLSHKYVKNTSTGVTAPTEHLLNATRRPQTSQKRLGAPAGCQA